MNRDLSDQYRADPGSFGSNSHSGHEHHDHDHDHDHEDGELRTETLIEALGRFITVDEEQQALVGCNDDFRYTLAILAEHGQEESANEVIALLNKQGAYSDCDVLTMSTIDLVFLESDALDYYEVDEEEEEA